MKISHEAVVAAALDLLDEVGLDAVTTRALATRLGVEQPSLYYHVRNKKELFTAMAEAAMAPHATLPLPQPGDDWREWFRDNTRSFRRTLLARRDGARLHAGSSPQRADLDRLSHKMEFLYAAGLPERDAQLAMLTASRFTVGSVLEEQAAIDTAPATAPSTAPATAPAVAAPIDHDSAFEAGLTLIVEGLLRTARPRTAHAAPDDRVAARP